MRCPSCDGKGIIVYGPTSVPKGRLCPECGGRGKVLGAWGALALLIIALGLIFWGYVLMVAFT
jgi:hypothetical protein